MSLSYHYTHDILVLDVPEGGNGKVAADSSFMEKLIELCTKNDTSKVVLNLEKCTYLNSTGLGELIRIKDALLDVKGIQLVLMNVSNKVLSLLQMVGVDDFFLIISSEDELV